MREMEGMHGKDFEFIVYDILKKTFHLKYREESKTSKMINPFNFLIDFPK